MQGLAAAGYHFVATDHLGTAQVLVNASEERSWKAVSEAFGKAVVFEEAVRFSLRLPGQYFDAETGLHYNYFRDYDPSTGRYVESDPIGLNGGMNTYVYVDSNPLRWLDYRGLDKCTCKASITGNRVTDRQGPRYGEKICTYKCAYETGCDEKYKKYTKAIEVSAGSGGSAMCKGQWEDPWQPNTNFRTGFEDFMIYTDGYSLPALWDSIFNSDFVDALNAGGGDT